MAKFVSYLRVSTGRQGSSGLGLEAQREGVSRYIAKDGGELAQEFVEVESGRNNNRPVLKRALATCRLEKATLIVAKFDRLGRNAAFLLAFMESNVPFVACDVPQFNELTLGMLALVAQYEAKVISERTKAALAAAKRRGVKLGSARPGHWDGREHLRSSGQAKATQAAAKKKKRESRQKRRDRFTARGEDETQP